MLIVETLVAAIYCGLPITMEMETEDGKTYTEFDTRLLYPVQLEPLDVEILKMLEEVRLPIKIISEGLRVSKPTAWRHVKKLQEIGFVELEGVTDRGRMGVRSSYPAHPVHD